MFALFFQKTTGHDTKAVQTFYPILAILVWNCLNFADKIVLLQVIFTFRLLLHIPCIVHWSQFGFTLEIQCNHVPIDQRV